MGFDNEGDRPPTDGAPGVIRRLARGTISMLPVAGPFVSELFDLVLVPVVEARRENWFADLAKRLKKLEETRGLTLDDLRRNPAFTDAVMQAHRSADATSAKEKREALRNAVLNTALGRSPDADKQQVLLRCVDELTPTHFQILRLIRENSPSNPNRRLTPESSRPLWEVLEEHLPTLAAREPTPRPLTGLFCRHLVDRGLILDMPALLLKAISQTYLTELGQQLLDFIATPPESE
jgi:hypothetical protein